MEHSRLVGRQQEMTALGDWLDAAVSGHPQLVVCGGEPGIGKTLLAQELAALAETRGVKVAWARAPQGLAPPPFWLWRQAFGPGDDLLAVRSGGEAREGESEAGRLRLFDAVAHRLFDDAHACGLLLVIDDAQWADQSSLTLLGYLARELQSARLMLLVTHRTVATEANQRWQAVLAELLARPVTRQLHLRGFTTAETMVCIEAVTGTAAPARVAREVRRLSGGNPFFVGELAHAWAEAPDGGDGRLPTSVIEVVGERVGRLSTATRQLLDAAAVLGEQFAVAVAASLIDSPVVACLSTLGEAADAGLIEATRTPGEWRFTHALVREAVEARIPVADRVALHRKAAVAIEATYAGQLRPRLADLARHWAVVAVTGERSNAVHWATLAAEEAVASLAYEEAARLYQLALDACAAEIGDGTRARLLLGLAAAHWRSAQLAPCIAACRQVVDHARRKGRPDLLGEAALVLEAIGSQRWDRDVRQWCEEALAGLGESQPSLRVRLLARLTEASIYLGDDGSVGDISRRALDLANQVGEAPAVVAALRARQLALSGPEHVKERTVLAARMIESGSVLRRPTIEMWGWLWRIDTCWERGDLSAISTALAKLAWCVEHVGGPLAHWHLVVCRAALAQAFGRFSEALELSRQGFESMRAARHPAAFGAHMSLLCALGHHIGHDQAGTTDPPADESVSPLTEPGEVRDAIFAHLAPALVLAELGSLDEAATLYRRAGPVQRWQPPPYFRVLAWAVGSMVAVVLDERDDVIWLHERLVAERGRQAVGGAGNASYFGPVELHLGRIEAFLGHLNDAEADLAVAASSCRTMGAEGFAVEADCERAVVLARRGAEGDIDLARSLGRGAQAAATRLGMMRWAPRAAEIVAATARTARAGGLSARETEVAELVGRGQTNREIASRLFISERTAQTHVQHILAKLGFSTRSQIASWVALSVPDRGANT
ncbi:MAG: helix-turn-helix transcriptional regulator [Acidimicrobiales bacterium]